MHKQLGDKTMHCYRLSIIAAVITFCGCVDQGEENGIQPLKIMEVDFVLDGGSIYFDLAGQQGSEEICVFVICPESPVLQRYFPEADTTGPVVVVSSSSDDLENAKVVSNEWIGEMLDRLSSHHQVQPELLTESVIAYFTHIYKHGKVPLYWGFMAVDTLIKQGRGADCFKELKDFPTSFDYSNAHKNPPDLSGY